MTLIVARVENGRLAIAADTMVSAHGQSLPMQAWVLKSICLPGGICVSYSGSPELAANAFQDFRERNPQGANHGATVAFFEVSSAHTNNDYIVAFADTAKLVTIRDGRRAECKTCVCSLWRDAADVELATLSMGLSQEATA